MNFQSRDGNIGKREAPLRILTATILVASTLQSFLFFILDSNFDVTTAIALTIALYDIQGCVKYLTVLLNLRSLAVIKEKLENLMDMMTKGQVDANRGELNIFRKVTTWILGTYTITMWITSALPLILYAYFCIVEGVEKKSLPCAFWYPFDRFEYFAFTYPYEAVSGHILTVVSPAMDGLFLLMVGQFVVLFKCLGENFANIINDFKPSSRERNVEELVKAIDLHNHLQDLSAEFFAIFEIPLLINVMAQTLSTCFISFIVTVNVSCTTKNYSKFQFFRRKKLCW